MSEHDDTFRALADPHRRRILSAVCETPRVAGELASLVGLAPNAVSFHLKWLKSAGLVRVQRRGRFLQYHPVPTALANWREHLKTIFPLQPSREPDGFSPLPHTRHPTSLPRDTREISREPAEVTLEEAEAFPTELL